MSLNARPKGTRTVPAEEDSTDLDGGQQDEIEVGEPVDKIVMLFAAEREGKRWMDLLSGAQTLLCPTCILSPQGRSNE